ncbi:hypothetical protein [Burkholderia sp. Bp9099]|uniref:hypothetical protein n=1 Tax=Burkholderia sp. Bp9099 TaxID=2184568 RepID=UPI00163ABF2E|nr:hypothetical protein [Burkholderia sp. Bp9099]
MLLPAVALVALYAANPFNFAVPFVGIVGDGVLVPMALHLMIRCLPISYNIYTTDEA